MDSTQVRSSNAGQSLTFWGRDYIRRQFQTFDKRKLIVIIAWLISVMATTLVYIFGFWLDPITHMGAVFAGWVAGVLLFTIVGVAAALVGLAKPEDGTFDDRARILFKRQSGKHIEYIISQIRRAVEHYADSMRRKIIIKEYHDGEGKFRIAVETDTIVRSYIDDIQSTYESELTIIEVTEAPAGYQRNKLTYLRIDDSSCCQVTEFSSEFRKTFTTTIEPFGFRRVQSGHEVWVKANEEEIAFRPKRYTKSLTLEVDNRLPNNHAVTIKLTKNNGQTWSQSSLPAGSSSVFLTASECFPPDRVFALKIF